MSSRQTVITALYACACLALTQLNAEGQTRPSAGMLRFPDVSRNKIVFVYADDLWTVPRRGGIASPLASPAGPERFPRFSPDGKKIAFLGNYEGHQDIYTLPVRGGVAKRISYHPADKMLCDWHPSGKSLIYATNGFAGLNRQMQLFTISSRSRLPDRLPVPYGTNGAISPDGKWLAYTPHSRDTRTWKRYRGGMASDIWLFHLEKQTARQITDFEGTDSLPMWHGANVYYLSDAGDEHRLNIWSYDTESGERKQVTTFEDNDCKWPAMGPGAKGKGEIVLQNGANLYLLDLATEELRPVDVTIPGDRPRLRRQKIDASKFIAGLDISSRGKRVVVEARGDIWSLPAEKGTARNLTRTSGVAERFPSWSPDGRWIAYFSDQTGEYELYITQSDGRGKTKQLTENGTCYRYNPVWSPDSKFVAFTDKTGALWLHSLDDESTRKIDADPFAEQLDISWSHNSQWITYALSSDDKTPTSSIWVYRISDGVKRKLTAGYFPDTHPTFDRKGEYIFFASNRSFGSPKYDDLGTSFIYSDSEVLMAMPLRADVEYPFTPKSDEETWGDEDQQGDDEEDKEQDGDEDEEEDDNEDGEEEEDKESESEDQDESEDKEKGKRKDKDKRQPGDESEGEVAPTPASKSADAADKEEKAVPKDFDIEFDGSEIRAFRIPVDGGRFGSLAVNHKQQLIFVRRSGSAGRGRRTPGEGTSVMLFDLQDEERKAKTVVTGAGQFAISADGKKLLILKGPGKAYVVGAAAGQKLEKPVPTSNMTVMIDPREEWRQMFVEAWRIERDFFYDPNMHGLDWTAIRDHYAAMLDDCVSRRDLSFVISEMIAELNVGHAYYREGDVDNGPHGNVGLLGCRFEVDDGAYRIAELYEGAAWDVDARNPLRTAGVQVGNYLVAVNDLPLTTKENPYAAFQGLAGSTITLTVSEDASLDDQDRRITIQPSGSDENLRFRGMIEHNRQYVEQQTDGQVGYIYVVNTGVPGQNDLVRQFYAQLNKQALIIDDRWNGGGQIPTRFIELLNRPVTNYWAKRDGRDWTWPPDAHHGPKCMLINGMAGSGGDMFPALFRQAGLGKLIGMRTWGGLVGISGNPGLIDGAGVTAPTFAYYELDGTWGIEGHGVDPDLRVVDDPEKMAGGGDPQLDAAIQHLLSELRTNTYRKPTRPPYPDRSDFGIAPKDQ